MKWLYFFLASISPKLLNVRNVDKLKDVTEGESKVIQTQVEDGRRLSGKFSGLEKMKQARMEKDSGKEEEEERALLFNLF